MDGLGNCSDLVDLEQETVTSFLLDSGLDSKGVGDSKVVPDDLDVGVGGEVSPSLPVVLVERILNGDNGVLLNVANVEVRELDAGKPFRGIGIGVLEVKIVFSILVELRGGNI